MAAECIPDIRIGLVWQGKVYKGYFTRVSGAGSSLYFHLYVNGFFMGQFFRRRDRWVLCLYNGSGEHPLSDFFEGYIAAYLDGVMKTVDW